MIGFVFLLSSLLFIKVSLELMADGKRENVFTLKYHTAVLEGPGRSLYAYIPRVSNANPIWIVSEGDSFGLLVMRMRSLFYIFIQHSRKSSEGVKMIFYYTEQ
jgi:hypothetical protein